MKALKVWLAAFALVLCGQVSASIIQDVHLEFDSGATWDGTITFNDGYEGMIDAEGWLVGGSNNFNEFFSWTWWQGTGQTNPQDWNSDGWYNDWVMNGTESGGYSMYIGLSWDIVGSTLSFVLLADPYYSGNIAYSDLLTDWSTVPTPSALLLGLFGLSLLMLNRRRRMS